MDTHDWPDTTNTDSDERTKARLTLSTLLGAESPEPSDPRRYVGDSLRTLPELARHVVGADYGAVTVLDDDGNVTDMLYAGMSTRDADRIGDPPKGIGLLGRLGDRDAPLRLEHMANHPESAGFPPGHPPMESLLGVRVTSGSGGRANLYVANAPGKPGFTEEDEQKILALASYAGLALDNAVLYEEERNQRAAAEAAGQRLAAVIRGSAAGVVVKSAVDGRFVEVSGEATRISGIQFDDRDSSATQFEQLHHHPDGTPMRPEQIPMNIALSQGEPAGPLEVLFIRPDSSRVPVLVSAAPVMDGDDQLDSVVCVFVDVTRLKELERAKDEFLSMITHDLRTPLTTIKGMAEAALDAASASDAEGAVGFLAPIDDEVDYLTDLISNLLDMTRIEAGGDIFDPEVCHLADITLDSLARINRSRDAKGRYIHSNVPPDLPSVFADPGQIGRVLDNLVSNALKYSDSGIRIAGFTTDDGNRIRVEVADRGPGIPADQTEAIFDRFARVKGARRGGRQGSGLGLAICKSIIKAHSGEIGVESSQNGSVFWFTLPVDTGPSVSN